MQFTVLEILEDERYLRVYRGFLLVMYGEKELGRIPLDELNSVILSANQATLSKALMVRLAELGVPVVVCGSNYLPVSITLPIENNHQFSDVLKLQIAVRMPLKKRLWQSLVKRKIEHQGMIIEAHDPTQKGVIEQLGRLVSKVKSGDPENCEAQAAKLYWRSLMGDGFRRSGKSATDATNGALNYGYAIIRAACARAIVGAGLHPSLGLHHHNRRNAFCLADDLMEIYRPAVDHVVKRQELNNELSTHNKRELAALLKADINLEGSITSINHSMQRLSETLVQSLREGKNCLNIPRLVLN